MFQLMREVQTASSMGQNVMVNLWMVLHCPSSPPCESNGSLLSLFLSYEERLLEVAVSAWSSILTVGL